MFLDERGVRRRWVGLGGALLAGAAALWLGALVAGSIGFGSLPALRALPRGPLATLARQTPVAGAGLPARTASREVALVSHRHASKVGPHRVRLTAGTGVRRDVARPEAREASVRLGVSTRGVAAS